MRGVQPCKAQSGLAFSRRFAYLLRVSVAQAGLHFRAAFAYLHLKFLVDMTKSGSTRSRSFLLPARRLGN